MNSKVDHVFNALVNKRESLTAKQIASRYNVANPHDTIYQLRSEGISIYSNTAKNSRGETVTKYRFGTPSRKMVAAAFAAVGAQAFS